jgi:hypothetical protein
MSMLPDAVARRRLRMAMSHPNSRPEPAALRRQLAALLRPYVDGTGAGIESSLLTRARVAATARDAAAAVLPLLGTPAPSAHRVRGAIMPALVCSWTELETVFAQTIDRLLALPPALPDVPDPAWDAGLEETRASRQRVRGDHPEWTPTATEGETVTGPAGSVGVVVRADRRHVLIVEDGRSLRTHARCRCDPLRRRERGDVAFELIALGRRRAVLDVRAGSACALCRAPIEPVRS